MAEAGIPSPRQLVLSSEVSAQARLWESWLQELTIYFEAANITAANSRENVLDYITRLKKIAKSCEFDQYSPDGALVDHYIFTCSSNIIRRKLLSEENLTRVAKNVKPSYKQKLGFQNLPTDFFLTNFHDKTNSEEATHRTHQALRWFDLFVGLLVTT